MKLPESTKVSITSARPRWHVGWVPLGGGTGWPRGTSTGAGVAGGHGSLLAHSPPRGSGDTGARRSSGLPVTVVHVLTKATLFPCQNSARLLEAAARLEHPVWA